MRRLLCTGAVVLAATLLGAGHADASHLRYSSISAQATGGDSYTFSFSTGQAGCATVGNAFTSPLLLQFIEVDTLAPKMISVEHVAAPMGKAPAAATTVAASEQPRKFFKLKGVDGGSGIVGLQISPREGKVWGWRDFVPSFSAPIRQKTVKVRIADAAGNVSDWFVVSVSRLR
jgi:hypothetical protein